MLGWYNPRLGSDEQRLGTGDEFPWPKPRILPTVVRRLGRWPLPNGYPVISIETPVFLSSHFAGFRTASYLYRVLFYC